MTSHQTPGPQDPPDPAMRTPRAPRPVRARRAGLEEYQPPARVPRRRTGPARARRVSLPLVRVLRPPTAPAHRPDPSTGPHADSPTGTPAPAARAPREVQVFEDHDLPEGARATVWEDLVDWVIWVHDAYELSLEEALPSCWPKHPGLVRELAALRAWRAEIYLPYPEQGHEVHAPTPAPVPNGGAARAWHAELRNVLAAVKKMYAPRCRAGHHDAPETWQEKSDQRRGWVTDVPAVLSPRRDHFDWPGPGGASGPGRGASVMTDARMQAALAGGWAARAGAHTDGYLRHQDTWWARRAEGDWVAITDPAVSRRLDRYAAATARAEAAVADASRPVTR